MEVINNTHLDPFSKDNVTYKIIIPAQRLSSLGGDQQHSSQSKEQRQCQRHLDLKSSKNNVKHKIRPPTNTGVLGKQLLGYRIYIKEPRCSSSRQVNIQPYSAFLKHPGFITTSPQARGLCEPVSPMTLMGAKVTRLGGNFESSESGVNFPGRRCPTSAPRPSTSSG